MKYAITLRNVSKIFRDHPKERAMPVLKNFNLEIRQGEFFVFVGPSGSGKSTILRIMSGLEREFEGKVILDPAIKRMDIAFVFQQFALMPWLSVFENVEFGLLSRRMTKEARRNRVMKELKRLGLQKFANHYPKDLSGGLRQRVGIARALAIDPKVIFMDEPFSELDSFTAEELRQEFLHLWQATKPTIVMVTHLIPEALELADRIAVLSPRPATIEKIITNRLPRPREQRSEAFYKSEDALVSLIKP